jgi:hypothetical protein
MRSMGTEARQGGATTNLDDLVALAVVVDDRHGGVDKGPCADQRTILYTRFRHKRLTETLDNALLVIIVPS